MPTIERGLAPCWDICEAHSGGCGVARAARMQLYAPAAAGKTALIAHLSRIFPKPTNSAVYYKYELTMASTLRDLRARANRRKRSYMGEPRPSLISPSSIVSAARDRVRQHVCALCSPPNDET